MPVAIAGHAYQIDARAVAEQSVPMLRQQADTTDLPAEHSLNPQGLWRRSQESWHHGAGQVFFDGQSSRLSGVVGTAADPERFNTSTGVDVWTRGQVSLLYQTVRIRTLADFAYGPIAAAADHLYVADGQQVYWQSNPTTTGGTWTSAVINAGQAAQTVNSLASNGYYVWAAMGSSGLHRTVKGAITSTADVPAQACTLVGYALGRLLIANAQSLYEVRTPIGGPTAVELFAHPDSNFVWQGISPGRNCATGDHMVMTTNRGEVRIDELVPGQDRLVSYDPHTQRVFHGTAGWKSGNAQHGFDFQRAMRMFTGNLVVMTTDETQTRVTPNHYIPARWHREAASASCVYLMRKGDWWRVGKSKLHHNGRFGPAARAATEGADACWLLGVYATDQEALVAEAYLSAVYGIAQAVFRYDRSGPRQPVISDEMLKDLHTRLAARGSGERARLLLRDLNLEIDYPFWAVGRGAKYGMCIPMKLEACNLVTGWMEVPIYTSYTTASVPWLLVSVDHEPVVEIPVYSLNVEPYHSYVGDGQCLFNCIYAYGNTQGSTFGLNYGYDQGGNAEVYRIGLVDTATNLGAPIMATYLPDGESIYSLQFYAGGVILGTGRGLRLGIVDGPGNIDYGPLIESTRTTATGYVPVAGVEPQGRYVWYTGGETLGLNRADLGYLTDTLVPAYAGDLDVFPYPGASSEYGITRQAVSLVTPPNPVFTYYQGVISGGTNESGVYRATTTRVASGSFETGRIRFGTTASKTLRRLDIRHLPLPAGASILCELKRDGGSWATVGTSSTTSATSATFDVGSLAAETIELRFTLNRATDTTTGPTLTRWTLHALPTPRRDEQFALPLLLRAVVEGGDGLPYPVDVPAEKTFLKGLWRDGTVFTLQLGADSYQATIQDYKFEGESMSPPMSDSGGYGPRRYVQGTLTLIVQTVGA